MRIKINSCISSIGQSIFLLKSLDKLEIDNDKSYFYIRFQIINFKKVHICELSKLLIAVYQ